jgi:NAD(P)-dependent dehydrogenase (short-subunit alcohol dehydrogenase family)
VKELEAKGVKAAAFPCDLADPAATRALIGAVRAKLGPVTVIHWNAYTSEAGDILTADATALHRVFDIAVGSLIGAVQEALPDMKQYPNEAAVLVTNGGFALLDSNTEAFSAQGNYMGISIANAAKHKLVGLLSAKLKGDGIYVGEVMVLGAIKGTAWDSGNATIEASAVAEQFFSIFKKRTEVRTQIA